MTTTFISVNTTMAFVLMAVAITAYLLSSFVQLDYHSLPHTSQVTGKAMEPHRPDTGKMREGGYGYSSETSSFAKAGGNNTAESADIGTHANANTDPYVATHLLGTEAGRMYGGSNLQ